MPNKKKTVKRLSTRDIPIAHYSKPNKLTSKSTKPTGKLSIYDDKVQEAARAAIDELRYRCLTDLYFLSRDVLGYKDVVHSFHKPFCDIIQANNPAVISMAGDDCPLAKTDKGAQYIAKALVCNGLGEDVGSGGGMGGQEVSQPSNNPTKYLSPINLRKQLANTRIESYVDFGGKNDMRERAFFLFRGSFKTTLITICHSIQLMLLNPNIRILINSHKKDGGSIPILSSIKQHFQDNEMLRLLFPEYMPKANSKGLVEWGTAEKILLPNRSKTKILPEDTIEVSGVTTAMVGRHYDYIKNDDIVTGDTVTNESMLAKSRESKDLQKFLFNQPEWGLTDNVGTIYHFSDLHAKMLKSSMFKVVIPVWDEEENILVPERFTKAGIETIKEQMGSFEFASQYLLNPIPKEDQKFLPEWFERLDFYYDPSILANLKLKIDMYVDPAAARNKKSDYTAIAIIGVDTNHTKYLIEILRDKLSPEERTNLVLEKAKQHNIHKIHYETVGFQDTDCYIINRKSREENYYLDIIEIKASGASKKDRIQGLQPLYERGDIRWPKNMRYTSQYDGKSHDMNQELLDEFFMFPFGEHDDMIDAHSFMLRNPEYAPGKPKPKPTEDDNFERLRKLVIAKKKGVNPTKPGQTFTQRNKRYQVPCIPSLSRSL
jgi:predicted phage terminase large subunit-like protein